MGLFQDPVSGHSCWTCEHWEVEHPHPHSATCLRDRICLRSLPESGCAFWTRATGHDDEAEPAPGGSRFTY